MRLAAVFTASVCLAWISVAAPNHAQIYTWVDENGVTHYSDSKADAPANHHPIGERRPRIHNSIPKPDPALSRILRAAEREREQRLPSPPRRPVARSKSTRCASYQRQLEKLQAKLRRGYREPRGNALRAKRRRVQAKYNTECR